VDSNPRHAPPKRLSQHLEFLLALLCLQFQLLAQLTVVPVLGDWSFDPEVFWATNDYDNAEFIPHCRPTLGPQNAVINDERRATPCCEYPVEGMVARVEQL